MSHQIVHTAGDEALIHDPRILATAPDWLFDPDALDSRGLIRATSHGRRRVWFFRWNDQTLVLRHYWRGGIVSRLSSDVYAWTGRDRTRAFREWHLLARLRAKGLCVPTPVAARIQRLGLGLGYRADLITAAIPDTTPFDERLQAVTEEAQPLWYQVGLTIGAFHAAGAFHADLNVRNILIDATGQPWLIDWDRGQLRYSDPSWQARRLSRLRRSLSRHPTLETQAQQYWPDLLAGHEAGLVNPNGARLEYDQ